VQPARRVDTVGVLTSTSGPSTRRIQDADVRTAEQLGWKLPTRSSSRSRAAASSCAIVRRRGAGRVRLSMKNACRVHRRPGAWLLAGVQRVELGDPERVLRSNRTRSPLDRDRKPSDGMYVNRIAARRWRRGGCDRGGDRRSDRLLARTRVSSPRLRAESRSACSRSLPRQGAGTVTRWCRIRHWSRTQDRDVLQRQTATQAREIEPTLSRFAKW